MNRRQFLACSLSATVAASVTPWDRFVEWCERWLGVVRRKSRSVLTTFHAFLKEHYTPEMVDLLPGHPRLRWVVE